MRCCNAAGVLVMGWGRSWWRRRRWTWANSPMDGMRADASRGGCGRSDGVWPGDGCVYDGPVRGDVCQRVDAGHGTEGPRGDRAVADAWLSRGVIAAAGEFGIRRVRVRLGHLVA